MSDQITGGMIIAIHEARDACRGELDLLERLRKAMRICHDHWMETDKSNQLRAAVGAALLETTDSAEKLRIERSFHRLGQLSAALTAMQAGVPVDLTAIADDDKDIIPIMGLWHETASK